MCQHQACKSEFDLWNALGGTTPTNCPQTSTISSWHIQKNKKILIINLKKCVIFLEYIPNKYFSILFLYTTGSYISFNECINSRFGNYFFRKPRNYGLRRGLVGKMLASQVLRMHSNPQGTQQKQAMGAHICHASVSRRTGARD